jgi:hypothetical protein
MNLQPLKKVDPNPTQNMKRVEPNPIIFLTMFESSQPVKRGVSIPNLFIKKVEQMKNATEFQKYCQVEFQKNIQKITQDANRKRDSPEEKMKHSVEEFWKKRTC